MQPEAVTVCVGYADFLREVAALNRPHFVRWVVVTTPEDEETRAVCRASSIDCVTTRDFARNGADFGKGFGIERGLSHLQGRGWVLHLDADIALPADFQQVVEDAHLDAAHLYGVDRLNVTGYDAWKRVKARGLWCRPSAWAVELDRPDCKLGARVANTRHGWTPIGFFQLWHGSESNWREFPAKRYPDHHGTAARTDVQMALQWDRRQRTLIPELLVWHLESEAAAMGANWKGRKTARFGPPPTAARPLSYS